MDYPAPASLASSGGLGRTWLLVPRSQNGSGNRSDMGLEEGYFKRVGIGGRSGTGLKWVAKKGSEKGPKQL